MPRVNAVTESRVVDRLMLLNMKNLLIGLRGNIIHIWVTVRLRTRMYKRSNSLNDSGDAARREEHRQDEENAEDDALHVRAQIGRGVYSGQ